LGTDPYRVLCTGQGQKDGPIDPLIAVQAELDRFRPVPVDGLPRFLGGAVGYLGYECVRYFEPRVPLASTDPVGVPESVFMFTDSLLVFDHLRQKIQVVSHAHVDPAGDVDSAWTEAVSRIDLMVMRLLGPLPSIDMASHSSGHLSDEPRPNKTAAEYHEMVGKAREYIISGDIIQVVPSQRLARPTNVSPFDIYRSLRTVNPSPYMYYLHLDDFDIVGASPELLVRVEDGMVDTHPIAGTRRRGQSEEEDLSLERELRADEKERAEHVMLLDLGRNDIGRVSKPGTVRVTQMMDVERYSHVMHLVSHVTGELAAGLTAYDALRACFPAGTVSGAPKIRAMEIISELEGERRGPYAGAVGYFGFSGNMDTAIAIRTMVVKNGIVYAQAGGGVVYDSDPELERQESWQKASGSLTAITEAEQQR
jgi:anthranilate synthase component 1